MAAEAIFFVAIVYLVAGYVLGRLHNPAPFWLTDVDPDPVPLPNEEHVAEVIPLRRIA